MYHHFLWSDAKFPCCSFYLRVNHHRETRYVWHSSSIEAFFILHREPECVLNVEANLNHQMAWQFKGYMGGCHFEVNRSSSTLKLDIPYWIDRTKATPPLQMRWVVMGELSGSPLQWSFNALYFVWMCVWICRKCEAWAHGRLSRSAFSLLCSRLREVKDSKAPSVFYYAQRTNIGGELFTCWGRGWLS